MSATLARRVQQVEGARRAAALADFRAALDTWLGRQHAARSQAEAEAALAALEAATAPAERARADRVLAALEVLRDPASSPAAIAAAAGVFVHVPEWGVNPGDPPYRVLEALAAHYRQGGDACPA